MKLRKEKGMEKEMENQKQTSYEQGRFEGHVMASLTEIKVHTGELAKSAAITETRLQNQIDALRGVVDGLVQYKSRITGMVVVLSVLSPIVTVIFTALITKWIR